MELKPGDKLGAYEIVSLLGKGGMGEVWKAHDPQIGRDVAIKVSAQQFTDRFEREARAIAALNHPNVCTLYHIGPDYLVMEYIEGPTLAERITRGPVPMDEALGIAKQIVYALEAAHDKNIVHRDLKPANVKIRPDGSVKVLDFGLAKTGEHAEVTADSPTMMSTMSMPGMILGTAAYMSPEQAAGQPVDKRADIWAFGVVLYEKLTGKRLFQGDSVAHVLADVLRGPIDLDTVPKETPRRVREVMKRCLDRDVRNRLRDIGEARVAIESAGVGEADGATPTPLQSLFGKVGWTAAVAVPTVLLAVLAFIHFRETPLAANTFRYSIAPPENSTVQSFAISPDGRLLAIAASANGKQQLWLRLLDALQAQPMPTTDDATFPFWSPDSRYIGFFAQGKLKKVAASGGPAESMCDAANPRGGVESRRCNSVFAVRRGPGGN
jgi:eukaryotic-like serine/threonine-protein kinase